ncbi:hypothetical protein DXZ75_04150 [Streptomyces sp. AcE210]|nr:hypothetical protein DXZ75_04150 [Streptomyces sp. AcE210]
MAGEGARRDVQRPARQVLPAVADGRIRPVMDSTLPYDRANTAAERLRTHQVHGKIILSMP